MVKKLTRKKSTKGVKSMRPSRLVKRDKALCLGNAKILRTINVGKEGKEMEKWDIKQASEADPSNLQRFLDEGYEPFAVTIQTTGYAIIWLRKKLPKTG